MTSVKEGQITGGLGLVLDRDYLGVAKGWVLTVALYGVGSYGTDVPLGITVKVRTKRDDLGIGTRLRMHFEAES